PAQTRLAILAVYPATVATIVADPLAGTLTVKAYPDDQAKIAEMIKERPSANKTLVAYTLRRTTSTQLSALILPLYPNVKFGAGTLPNQVVILAKADEHEVIASIIEQLEKATDGKSTVIYKLQYAVPAQARLAIHAVYPATVATIIADPLAGTLTVKAYPDDQAKIAEMIKTLDGAFTTEVYRLQYATPSVARASVLAVFPTATVVPDVVGKTLTVKTRPEDQPKIAEFIKEIDNTDDGKTTQVYRLKYAIPSVARTAILAVYPTATIVADPPSASASLLTASLARTLTVKTVPGDQPKIAAMIETLDVGDDGTTARVYRVKNSQQTAVQRAILQMYPQAVITLDAYSRSLLVKAYESDHAKIAQLVQEMDERDPERNTSFKIFNVGSLNFTRLLSALRNFYANDGAFQVQFDSAQQCLLVRGTAEQHKAVEQLIEEARQGGLADPESYMQSYTVENQSALSSLYSIFYEQGRDVKMYRDYSTGKLIVVGRPEEHKMVLDVLDVLEPEKTELAIF
ncbi:MAG: hypothetical protein IJO46_02605, partial [Thermoguttaceae bacterium]|nr:hypothetical protein [Thermoguttaceae bacterium]